MALLLTSVFGVTGCGSDDGEAPVESRIKNSTGDPALINNWLPSPPAKCSQDRTYFFDGEKFCVDDDERLSDLLDDDMDDDFSDSDDMIDYDKYEDEDDIHDGPDRDIKLKIPYELSDDINADFDDDPIDDIGLSEQGDDEIDYSEILKNAYSNLQGLLGPDGIKGLESENRKLLDPPSSDDLIGEISSDNLDRDAKLDLMRDHIHFHKHPYDMDDDFSDSDDMIDYDKYEDEDDILDLKDLGKDIEDEMYEEKRSIIED
jgi:pilus assembly protein FimV